MFINLSAFASPRSFVLFVKSLLWKLKYRDLISFSFFFNLLCRMSSIPPSHPPLTILDIGANKGQFALMSSLVFPTSFPIISCEPLPELEPFLRKVGYIIGQRFSYSMTAVSSSRGIVKLHRTSNNEQSSILAPIDIRSIPVTVSAQNINLLLSQINGPIFLKIDTQGYELEILKSIDQKYKHKIAYLLIEASIVSSYINQPSISDIMSFVSSSFDVMSFCFIDMLSNANGITECDIMYTFCRK